MTDCIVGHGGAWAKKDCVESLIRQLEFPTRIVKGDDKAAVVD
jgi:hypothetical protein